MSPDRSQGIVVIAFVGSVFSPFYFAKRQEVGQADPLDFCAFNVAVYDRGKRLWGFTEWSRERVTREPDRFVVGTNRIVREPGRITIDVDEACATGGHRIEGRIVMYPAHTADRSFVLDGGGAHRWHPIAPVGEMEVTLNRPGLRFRGSAYHDANNGDEPLEAALRRWSWSRHEVAGDTVVLYDGIRRDDSPFSLSLRFRPDGTVEEVDAPPMHRLSRSLWWRCPRSTRSEGGARPRIVRTLEDFPFYARTLLECTLFGECAPGVHESLELDRFTAKWMQWMLPFRIKQMS